MGYPYPNFAYVLFWGAVTAWQESAAEAALLDIAS